MVWTAWWGVVLSLRYIVARSLLASAFGVHWLLIVILHLFVYFVGFVLQQSLNVCYEKFSFIYVPTDASPKLPSPSLPKWWLGAPPYYTWWSLAYWLLFMNSDFSACQHIFLLHFTFGWLRLFWAFVLSPSFVYAMHLVSQFVWASCSIHYVHVLHNAHS